eukprot:5854278-Heterocapsa_arctica.AAC.1
MHTGLFLELPRRQLNSAVALPALADTIAACAGKHGRASGVVKDAGTTIVVKAANGAVVGASGIKRMSGRFPATSGRFPASIRFR